MILYNYKESIKDKRILTYTNICSIMESEYNRGGVFMEAVYSDFAYDDVFKTMVVKCDEMLIPFVNYMFDAHFTDEAKIYRGVNEHFIDGESGAQDKRNTDSGFSISEGDVSHTYHVECESRDDKDGSIIVRMFEYDAQIALERGDVNQGQLDVYFPHSGILFLRSSDETPDVMTVAMHTPGGKCSYPVQVMRESDYSLDMIFENRLFFLLPFYSFNYERDFKDIEADNHMQDEFVEMYNEVIDRLDAYVADGRLSSYSRDVIIRMIHKVTYKQLMRYSSTQERVGDLMGGKVLDLDVIRAHDDGIDVGRREGRSEGQNELVKAVEMLRQGKTADEIVELGIDRKTVELAVAIK